METRERLNLTVDGDTVEVPAVAPIESFDDMNIAQELLADIKGRGFER